MNKKIALLIIVVAIVGCLALTACDMFGGADVDGTYYGYDGTEKDTSDYIELKSGKWTDGTLDGTYELDGEKITLSSDGVVFASGTVKDGVLTMSALGQTLRYYTDAGWRDHATLTPGGNNGGNNGEGGNGSISSGEEDNKAKIVSVTGATMDGLTVNMELADTVEDVDLSGLVEVSDDSSWKLYYNRAATSADAIATKMIEPNDGENLYYIVVTSADGKVDRTYTLRVWKNYYVSITWKMAGNVIDTERVLTHTTLVDHAPGSVAGYEFISWNIGDGYVTGSRTIEALYEKARYTISFNANGWSIVDLTFDNNYIPSYTRTSNSTATASWTINRYAVSVVGGTDDNGEVDELDSDEYDYDNRVLLTAKPYLGYELEGWYECNRVGDPLKKISDEESFYYSVPAYDSVICAIWKVRDDMSNFEFTSTVTSTSRYCKITGVKDKTITTLTLPDCVTSVENNAFNDCTEITSAKMDAQQLNGFGEGNTKLTHLEIISGSISNSIGAIESVTHLTIGKYVSSVNLLGWSNSDNLVSLTFEEGFSGTVQSGAFLNCSNLSEINVPDSLTVLGSEAFKGTAWYNNQPDGEVYIGKIFYVYKGEMPENTSVVVKEGTLAIAVSAFWDKTNLTSVTIPSCVTYIGCRAFKGCTGLKEIAFSELSWIKVPHNSIYTPENNQYEVTLSATPSENVSTFVNGYDAHYCREAE